MAKDWTGSSVSPMKMLGASNHCAEDRAENDYYATDPEAIRTWLNERKPKLSKTILEPCAGEGHIAEVLKEYGYKVISCDLVQRDYPLDKVWDFLELPENEQNSYTIVTNPPFKYSLEFVEKAIKISKPGIDIWMFLKLQFLETKARREKIFNNNWLREVDVYTSRVRCSKNGDFEKDKGSAVCYCMFRFNNGETGEPIIKWIN